jgi:hypothetical protein
MKNKSINNNAIVLVSLGLLGLITFLAYKVYQASEEIDIPEFDFKEPWGDQ